MHLRRGRIWKTSIAMVAVSAFVPTGAQAEESDLESRLEEMNQRMNRLEEKLTATNDELDSARRTVDEQREVLREAGLEEDRGGALSALSSFLEKTDFNGWVATSYTFNTENDGNDGIRGQNENLPFHDDSNAFKLNQLWFAIDKDVDEESRAGFHADILFGSDAEALGGSGGSIFRDDDSGGNDGIELFTGYVSYLAPLMDGIRVDMGELPTLLGAEVVQSPQNFNITRGLLWNLQPVTHTGIIVSTEFESGLGVAAGFVNDGFNDFNRDNDDNKAFTGQLSYSGETWSAAASVLYGSPSFDGNGKYRSNEGDKEGMVDFLVTAQPMEELSIWINFDWGFNRSIVQIGRTGRVIQKYDDADVFGIAAAARYQVLETTGVAIRGELVAESDGYLGLPKGDGDSKLYSLTATIDHALTDNLLARIEGRFDWADIDGANNEIFLDANGRRKESDQQVLLAELIYNF
ncbi:MAG: outer membrane beta-barrel protein [Myxococcota bacterium]